MNEPGHPTTTKRQRSPQHIWESHGILKTHQGRAKEVHWISCPRCNQQTFLEPDYGTWTTLRTRTGCRAFHLRNPAADGESAQAHCGHTKKWAKPKKKLNPGITTRQSSWEHPDQQGWVITCPDCLHPGIERPSQREKEAQATQQLMPGSK